MMLKREYGVVKAVIFDVGGTLLGATDMLENILAGNTSTTVNAGH